MSGPCDAKIVDVLRTIPRQEMAQDRQEQIVRELKQAKMRGTGSAIPPSSNRRKHYRWIRSASAVGAAMIVVGGVVYQIMDHHRSLAPTKQAAPHAMSAAAKQLKAMLGFQPLQPTHLPAGVVEESTMAGINRNWKNQNLNEHVYSILYGYKDASRYQTVGSGSNQTKLAPLDITEEPLADEPTILQDFPSFKSVTVNGVHFMEPVQRKSSGKQPKEPSQPILLWKHNGLLFTVTGTQIRSELAKVLSNLVPVTTQPDEITKGTFGANANKMTAFRVILPKYIPNGFKQDLSQNTQGEDDEIPGKQVVSSYGTQYVSTGGTISIGEFYAKGTKNPQGLQKNMKNIVRTQIKGQTVYLLQAYTGVAENVMAPYYRFEWMDPKTKVIYWVDGTSRTTQELITKPLMEKVVSSMIAQSK